MQKYSPDIPPRHYHFTFPSVVPKYWHGNCPIKTYQFNALSVFLPILERILVLSLKKSLPEITDLTLKAEVASLVAQEAIHGREFSRYNEQVVFPYFDFSQHTYSLKGFRLFAGLFNKLSSTFHYALSAAGEHFTAITAAVFLNDPIWFDKANPQQSAIWRWHCIEEIEHKCVAFDVFEAMNGNYFIRTIAMLIMTVVFGLLNFKLVWHMIKQDRRQNDYAFHLSAFRYYWGKQGLFRVLLKPYFDYFKPSFHPSQHKNDHLIEQWKAYFDHTPPVEVLQGLESVNPPA